MNDELNLLINRYIANHNVMYEGDLKKEFEELTEFFNSGVQTYDRPDGFCKFENNVLIIEHFEFDSANANKKGSTNRQEIFRTSRIKPTGKEFELVYDEIKCDFTMENYIKNLKNNFLNHYNKIDDYIKNLQKINIINERTNIKVLFCIEDSTILGNLNIATQKPIFAIYCDEFIQLLKDCTKLNYILCCSNFGMSDYAWFASISKISEYEQKQIKVSDTKIANLTPQTVTSFIKV